MIDEVNNQKEETPQQGQQPQEQQQQQQQGQANPSQTQQGLQAPTSLGNLSLPSSVGMARVRDEAGQPGGRPPLPPSTRSFLESEQGQAAVGHLHTLAASTRSLATSAVDRNEHDGVANAQLLNPLNPKAASNSAAINGVVGETLKPIVQNVRRGGNTLSSIELRTDDPDKRHEVMADYIDDIMFVNPEQLKSKLSGPIFKVTMIVLDILDPEKRLNFHLQGRYLANTLRRGGSMPFDDIAITLLLTANASALFRDEEGTDVYTAWLLYVHEGARQIEAVKSTARAAIDAFDKAHAVLTKSGGASSYSTPGPSSVRLNPYLVALDARLLREGLVQEAVGGAKSKDSGNNNNNNNNSSNANRSRTGTPNNRGNGNDPRRDGQSRGNGGRSNNASNRGSANTSRSATPVPATPPPHAPPATRAASVNGPSRETLLEQCKQRDAAMMAGCDVTKVPYEMLQHIAEGKFARDTNVGWKLEAARWSRAMGPISRGEPPRQRR